MNGALRHLLAALAPRDPNVYSDTGNCVACLSSAPGIADVTGRYLSDHVVECPWVTARLLLGDRLPAARPEERAVAANIARDGFHDYARHDGIDNRPPAHPVTQTVTSTAAWETQRRIAADHLASLKPNPKP